MTTWLALNTDVDDTALASEEQVVFAGQVRELLDAVGCPGLDRENADVGIWSGSPPLNGLLIVLPLASSPHASIQLRMTSEMILGTWEDKHYIWDYTPDGEEVLRVEGVDEGARARALTWLDHEIRRPFVRREYRWGPLHATTWKHDDDGEIIWFDSEGFLPFRPPGVQYREEPAGFLDPRPEGLSTRCPG